MYQQTPFRIGQMRIEPLQYAVYPDNAPKQSLQPKFIDVLIYLANQYPNVVSRQELIEHIWQGNTYVGEKALTNAVWHLRNTLDQPNQPGIIQTIRKSGYRLLIEPEMIVPEKARLSFITSRIAPFFAVVFLSIILSTVFYYFTGSAQLRVNAIETITTEPGLELFPAPSPDGRYLVYNWFSQNRQMDLYQRDLTQPQLPAIRLTFDKAREGRAVWSRDGKKLYFRRKDNTNNYCDIVQLDVQSLEEHFIAKCPTSGSMHYIDTAPDNKTLAYLGIEAPETKPYIYLLDISTPGAQPRRLPCQLSCAQPEGDMAFSPDGQYLAFSKRSRRFNEDIHLINLTSGENKQLTFDKKDIVGITWHPNGQYLIYAEQIADVRSGFELDIDTLISSPLGINGFSSPSFVREKPWLFFQSFNEQYQIAAQSLDKTISSSPIPILQSVYNHKAPDYSAKNDQITYISNESGHYEIWLADADGRNRRQITDLKRTVRSPKWSHNGKYIAFLAPGNTVKKDHIYIVDVTTRRVTPVPSPYTEHNRPTWTPDDTAIISAVNSEGYHDLFRFKLDQQQTTRLTWDGGRYGVLIDNDTLIYTRTQRGLYKKTLGQKTGQELLDKEQFTVLYTWVYSDNGVYYRKLASDHQKIGLYSFTSQQFTPLLRLPLSTITTGSSMTLDSKRQQLLFTKTLFYQSDIKLIKNPQFH